MKITAFSFTLCGTRTDYYDMQCTHVNKHREGERERERIKVGMRRQNKITHEIIFTIQKIYNSVTLYVFTDELELMYEMCAFEKYSFNRTDWCNFLSDNDRKIMEYRADLEVCQTKNTEPEHDKTYKMAYAPCKGSN